MLKCPKCGTCYNDPNVSASWAKCTICGCTWHPGTQALMEEARRLMEHKLYLASLTPALRTDPLEAMHLEDKLLAEAVAAEAEMLRLKTIMKTW